MPIQVLRSSGSFRLVLDQPNPWRAGLIGLGIDLGLEDAHLVQGDKCEATKCQFVMTKIRRHKFTCCNGITRDVTSDKLVEQMAVLGSRLQFLETVEFDYSICCDCDGGGAYHDAPFPIKAISTLLRLRANTIKVLRLSRWQSLIGGTREEFHEFFECLRNCTKLQEFSLRCGCQFEVTDYLSSATTTTTTTQTTEGIPQERWVEDSISCILGPTMECVDTMNFDDEEEEGGAADCYDDFDLEEDESSEEFDIVPQKVAPFKPNDQCCKEGSEQLWLHVEPTHLPKEQL